ncbi:MAG: aminotransferase class V-fold PLP-dependent enzyme [Fibrobacter sp.]|nr:aminotransferase class V-fold PLP-dependent enzyme [Fibrobacter sp.]
MANTYFDNAATSYPKPPAVASYISRYINEIGGTYGRGAYRRIIESSSALETVRELLAKILGTGNAENVLFTQNATHAINTVLFGLNLHDCHVLISPLEHNAVMRPLHEISQRNNVTYEVLSHGPDGLIEVDKISRQIRTDTKLLIVNHQSNVNGLIQPVKEIKASAGSIPVLLDLAQSVGHSTISLDTWGIDFAAFTGHKGLLGPTGTGGVYIRQASAVNTFIFGGTGSRSESFEMPFGVPDKFEAGTPNIAGIYGLWGALENPPDHGHEFSDFIDFIREVDKIKNITLFRSKDISRQGELFSIKHHKYDSGYLADLLYSKFGIEIRSGLHCAPLAHKTLGSFPTGTVRFSVSPYHTIDDFTFLLKALETVSIL